MSRLEAFDQAFVDTAAGTGEHQLPVIYSFTPNIQHDPTQVETPLPRVMISLDAFPATPGMSMLVTRFEGADRTHELPDHVAAALGVVANKLVVHLLGKKSELDEVRNGGEEGPGLQRITRITSESSVKGAHELFVPTWVREDGPKPWARTYKEEDRADPDDLAHMQELLAFSDEDRAALDLALSSVYWCTADKIARTRALGLWKAGVRWASGAFRGKRPSLQPSN